MWQPPVNNLQPSLDESGSTRPVKSHALHVWHTHSSLFSCSHANIRSLISHIPCASTVLVLLLKKTSRAGLTIASAVSGHVAKLQSVHGVHYLRFRSDRGCRMAEQGIRIWNSIWIKIFPNQGRKGEEFHPKQPRFSPKVTDTHNIRTAPKIQWSDIKFHSMCFHRPTLAWMQFAVYWYVHNYIPCVRET